MLSASAESALKASDSLPCASSSKPSFSFAALRSASSWVSSELIRASRLGVFVLKRGQLRVQIRSGQLSSLRV